MKAKILIDFKSILIHIFLILIGCLYKIIQVTSFLELVIKIEKQFFPKKQSEIEPIKTSNNKVNKKIAQLIHNKTPSSENKLNKDMKVVKILNKNQVTYDHAV